MLSCASRSLAFFLFLIVLLVWIPQRPFAEEWTPQMIVDAFFNRGGIKNKKAIYSGEMIEHYLDKPTMGQMLDFDTKIDEIRMLDQGEKSAVFAVSISNKGRVFDYYLFLRRKNTWKLEAVRTLWLSGLFFAALEELENKNNRTAEEESQYQNMLLTVQSDKDLKRFLSANVKKLQEIADYAMKGNINKADTLAEKLKLNKVFLPEDYPGIIEINIGGMIDNSVGFMYVPDGKEPPGMSSGGYIYIEKVVEHWYLYKTT